ncbi:MAG: SPFH domain-containing protein [Rhodopila sp.]
MISRDNASVKVNTVVYFRVMDADHAVIEVDNFMAATTQLAQSTLRSVLGKHDLDEMLTERDKLNRDIQEILDTQTDAWGIKVGNVEIKHVDIDESMVRAIARQAEAERNRRGRIIDAEGEMQAAEKLADAARVPVAVPEAMQLRYLSTLQLIASERNSMVVFPVPIDLLRGLGNFASAARRESRD